MASSWLDSWGNSWGDSWGEVTVDPNAMVGSGTFGIQAAGTLTAAVVSDVVDVVGGGILPKRHPWIHFQDLAEVADLKPELADAVIEAVATVVEKRTVQNKDLETTQAEKELRKFLKSQEQRWKKEYTQLILLEYERINQEIEDAQIAMMLFEM
jgi:hypothetical protein